MFHAKREAGKSLIIIFSCFVCLFFLWGASEVQAASITIKKPPAETDTQKVIIKKIPDLKQIPSDPGKIPVEVKKMPEMIRQVAITPETVGTLKATPRGVWEAQGGRDGTFFILLSEEVRNVENLMPYIQTYAEDVASEGYKVKLFTIAFEGTMDPFFTNVKNLKSFIRSKWLETLKECEESRLSKEAFDLGTGLVLIGPFPLPMVHKRMETWKEDPEGSGNMKEVLYEGVFACDLYLTDMDGNWNLLDEMGYPLVTTVDYPDIPMDHECIAGDEVHPHWTGNTNDWGRMGARPEIWMGRINPQNTEFYKTADHMAIMYYLDANHNYRKGIGTQSPEEVEEQTYKNRLIYYDDDMRDLAQSAADMMSIRWPGPVFGENSYAGTGHANGYTRIVNGTNTTSKADYVERLKLGNYLWVEAFMHSAPDLHQFTVASGIENLYRQELFREQKMKALFYYHHGCSACNYARRDNLGENYLFFPNQMGALKPMAVLGNTTVGPHETGMFYVSMAYGMNIGQAQMISQRSFARHQNWGTTYPANPGHVNPKRYYSQTLFGDPTLSPHLFAPNLLPTPPNLPSVYGTVVQNVSGASFPDLNKLRMAANAAASAEPVMKKGLPPGKAYPVLSGGAVRDPLWQEMGITRLENLVKPLKIQDMVEFDINKVKIQ